MRIDNFECHLRFERQLSINTIKQYLRSIRKLEEYLNKPASEFNQNDVKDFLAMLERKGVCGNSKGNFIVALRAYFRWMVYSKGDNHSKDMSFYLTSIIKVKRKCRVTQVPTLKEVKQLRECFAAYRKSYAFDKNTRKFGKFLRDYSLIEFLLCTGMRSSEVRSLKLCDFDFGKRIVTTRITKSKKHRNSLITGHAVDAVKEYSLYMRMKEQDNVFPIKFGNGMNYIIRKWCKLANINRKIHAHSFRHYFVTESYRQGIDINAIANQVGHESLNTTKRYIHNSLEILKEKYVDFKQITVDDSGTRTVVKQELGKLLGNLQVTDEKVPDEFVKKAKASAEENEKIGFQS